MNSPLIWPSITRLVATSGIFGFHFLGQLGNYQYRLDTFSILIFCFLSGYLVKAKKKIGFSWIIHRYFGIMVPYWLVIIPVLFANQVLQYKKVSLTAQIITFFGGNLFLENPLYIMGWFVTFIVLWYFYVFIETFFDSWQVFICMAIGALLFFVWLGQGYNFIALITGLRLSNWYPARHQKWESIAFHKLAVVLFVVQRYCYAFFLIHGPVLLFFAKLSKSPVTALSLFWLSLLISSTLSVVLYAMAKPLQSLAVNKTMTLTEKTLACFSVAKIGR